MKQSGSILKALKKKDKLSLENYVVQSLNLIEVVKEKNKKLSSEHRK